MSYMSSTSPSCLITQVLQVKNLFQMSDRQNEHEMLSSPVEYKISMAGSHLFGAKHSDNIIRSNSLKRRPKSPSIRTDRLRLGSKDSPLRIQAYLRSVSWTIALDLYCSSRQTIRDFASDSSSANSSDSTVTRFHAAFRVHSPRFHT